MKVIYTETAKQELAEFNKRQQDLLEGLVSDRKTVFGDDVLEITASDIKEASKFIRPGGFKLRRFQASEFITRVYIVTGLAMMIGAFFYPQIERALENNPKQGLIFLMGAIISILGLVLGYWVKLRQRRLEEMSQPFPFNLDSHSRPLE